MSKIDFKRSAIQSLRIAALFPLIGILGFLYGVFFLIVLLPIMYFFPETLNAIAKFDTYLDIKVKGILNHE